MKLSHSPGAAFLSGRIPNPDGHGGLPVQMNPIAHGILPHQDDLPPGGANHPSKPFFNDEHSSTPGRDSIPVSRPFFIVTDQDQFTPTDSKALPERSEGGDAKRVTFVDKGQPARGRTEMNR